MHTEFINFENISIDEINNVQEIINMNLYSSNSLNKVRSIFSTEIYHGMCDITDVCIMGILYFLVNKDNSEKEKENEYISSSFNFKYDSIKKTIQRCTEITIKDFIKCYIDYKIINSLGKNTKNILFSISQIQTWVDSLYNFINEYKENFDYKKQLLYEIEKEWFFQDI